MGKMLTLRTRAGPTAVHNSTASIVPDYVLPRRHFPKSDQIIKRVGFVQFACVDQTHVKIAYPGASFGL